MQITAVSNPRNVSNVLFYNVTSNLTLASPQSNKGALGEYIGAFASLRWSSIFNCVKIERCKDAYTNAGPCIWRLVV